MPSGSGAASSSGSVGICPVTKSQPSAATAWLNGATGVGAPAIIKYSIIAGSLCRGRSLGRLDPGRRAPARMIGPVAPPGAHAGVGARVDLLAGDDLFEEALVLIGKQPVMHPRHPEYPEQPLAQCPPPALPPEQAPAVIEAAFAIDRRYPAQREVVA